LQGGGEEFRGFRLVFGKTVEGYQIIRFKVGSGEAGEGEGDAQGDRKEFQILDWEISVREVFWWDFPVRWAGLS
jgi:hypothetical protein